MKHLPFRSDTRKQAIREGFILNVLRNEKPIERCYRLIKTVEGDPEFDVKYIQKKLRYDVKVLGASLTVTIVVAEPAVAYEPTSS